MGSERFLLSGKSWMTTIVRVRTHSTHKSHFVSLTDFHSLCWLHFVSVFQSIQVTNGRWKETEWRYTTALCEAKEVDRQVSKKLPASPLCDLWAEWAAAGPGEILQQARIYRRVSRFLAVWCKVHKEGISPWTIISLVERLSTIFVILYKDTELALWRSTITWLTQWIASDKIYYSPVWSSW